MKRFTLLSMLVALMGVTAFAQNELVTPPATANVETWYTVDGMLYVNTPNGTQAVYPSVNVAIDGDDIYIQGLAYWFKEGWVKGTISGTIATFAGGQFVGEDEYGPEYICGTDDTETFSESIVFEYDAEEGLLVCVTEYILENPSLTEILPYCYWYKPTFSKTAPSGPQPVEAPEGLETTEWAINALTNYGDPVSGYLNIGFDGNDVYLQGLCTYLPESWIKGTLDGTTIYFPGNQYFGYYNGGPMNSYDFFLLPYGITFTYDAEAGKMTAEGEIFIYTGGSNLKGDVYNDPVVTKVTEKAATPAIPNISQIYDGIEAPIVIFSVPTTDVNGDAMASSKLTFQFLKDVEHEISPVTFEPADYTSLTETMSVFPYNYSNGNDFYPKRIYLRQSDYSTWNKIGLQATYTGGGEENKSEIFWLTIKEYLQAAFDFNAMTDVPCSSNASSDGDITEDRTFTAGEVTLTVSPKAEGTSTPNRLWSTNRGPQLRVYSGTLTFEVPADKVIKRIVFNNAKWNEGNSANTGTFEGNVWTGEARQVVVTIAGNTQVNSIDVFPADYVPTAVQAPEDLATDTYIFHSTAIRPYYDPAELTLWVEAGFDGDDVYIQGLAGDANPNADQLWVKATKNQAGQYVIPANQFMGSVSFWMSTMDFYFTALDDAGNMVDAVLDYDAEKQQFTTSQTLIVNASLTEVNAQQTFTEVTLTKFNEVAATPADPTVREILFDEWSHGFSCNIPAVDTDGETLNPGKLFYTVWIEKDGEQTPYVFTSAVYYNVSEDTAELPYSDNYSTYDNAHNIYFYDSDAAIFDSWDKLGIQSIYYGAGECRKSAIDWADVRGTGINEVKGQWSTVDGQSIYNLSGQRLHTTRKGLNIVNGKKVVIR